MTTIPSFTEESFKSQAHKLKAFLSAKGLALNYTGCLDAVAVQHGHKSWNHLHAALQAPPATTLSSEQAVENVLEAGYVHLQPQLEAVVASLSSLPKSLKTEISFYELSGSGYDDNTCRGELACSVSLDHDTVLSLTINTDYSNDFGAVDFNIEVVAQLARAGVGPMDRNGWREDKLEWVNIEYVDGLTVKLSEKSWDAQLLSLLKGIPLKSAIAAALESTHPDTLADIRKEFSKRIEGFDKSNLDFED